ncbi:ABC transporter ATP-binding protein [Halobaculum sp. MBLA0147]|uniref:ABC transporter ATP-binding protein n=1 Tax=Halobaculum sp. MBLA0147 TaxID=3079934 RepID=UPI003524656D
MSNVTKHYQLGGRVTALDGVSLSLPEGSYTAVMGPSGSGKSTLLNLIGGLDTPDSGEVSVDGSRLDNTDEATRANVRGTEIGFVFQTFDLLPRLTARQNVALPLTFAGWGRTERHDRATTLLDDVGLDDRLDHRPPELSGGQRQRVAIARALAADPSIVLADEPTGNVDTETGDEVLSLLDEVHASGNTVLLVTHARRVAERAQQIVHVRDGTIEGIERVEDDAPVLAAADNSSGVDVDTDTNTRGSKGREQGDRATTGGGED